MLFMMHKISSPAQLGDCFYHTPKHKKIIIVQTKYVVQWSSKVIVRDGFYPAYM